MVSCPLVLVNVSKERGVKQISLEATDMGRPLYEKYGFKIVSVREKYYGNDDAYLMIREMM